MSLCIDPRLRALDGEGEAVHDDHDVGVHLSEEEAHDLQVAARPRVHHHLEQGQGRDLYVLKHFSFLIDFNKNR